MKTNQIQRMKKLAPSEKKNGEIYKKKINSIDDLKEAIPNKKKIINMKKKKKKTNHLLLWT